MAENREASLRQKAHYERIHEEYEAHYYDEHSLRYRERFFLDPLFAGLDFNDRDVLDVASGSGHNTVLLRRRFPRLRAAGVDISEAACSGYRRTTGFDAVQGDLTRPLSLSRQFDAAMVIGGLHHMVVNLPQAVDNLAAFVKPGGWLLMMEPSADSILEGARALWYRQDRFFDAPTERGLSHGELLALAGERFRAERVRYIGGPAYFVIYNSLVLRVPLRAKGWIAPFVFPLERAFNAFNSRLTAPVFIARWRRCV
ncbi:MAG TPA: class I SAM-dependent methyltransferase [Gemmatimonadales bacterium]|nr:class I SAM-dependent methyltransferase [Gemmatimonadales bacterium]